MKVTLQNQQMLERVEQLKQFLPRKDKIGYAAGRNTRRLTDQLVEFNQIRNELIERYGTVSPDESGYASISIKIGSPEYVSFMEAVEPFAKIEHEVELFTVKYDDVIDILSGEEILSIDWMLED